MHETLAHNALSLWGLDKNTDIRLLNFSENTTFALHTKVGTDYVLRVHRLGYHDRTAIASELAWMTALNRDGALPTAAVIKGLDGEAIQQCASNDLTAHFLVLFEYLPGTEPQPEQDLCVPFAQLGTLAARSHFHSLRWKKPNFFARPSWDEYAVFDSNPLWGHWRNGPGVIPQHIQILRTAEECIIQRLTAYGKNPRHFGLIHADMRLANLLIDDSTTRVIDFDDCGYGWWMYDFAAAISFFEDHAQIPALKSAWLEGYQRIRPLQATDIAEIDTLIMLRRMNLLGWLGTHHDTQLAAELAPHFAEATARIAQAWMDSNNTTL
ncbi:MAG: phosphotransferase [Alphaproteobacteria bacterium]|nr:phosphotransferase [Alphaproteobacteria bacterium]